MCVLVGVRFIRGRLVHWGVPLGSSGSYSVLDYMGCTPRIDEIVRGCSIHWGGRPFRPG